MSLRWTQTNAALDEFFELLSCNFCKKTLERPIRLMVCGHTFCDKCCSRKKMTCMECNIPIRPNEMQRHHLIAELIHNCEIIKQAIGEINVEDIQADESTSKLESKAESAAKCPASVHDDDADKDLPSATPGYREPSQNVRTADGNDADSETPGYRDASQPAVRLKANETVSETPGYRETSQMCEKVEGNGTPTETLGYRDAALTLGSKQKRDSTKELSGESVSRGNGSKHRQVGTTNAFGEDDPVEPTLLAAESSVTTENFVDIDDRGKTPISECKETSDDEQISDTLSVGSLASEWILEPVTTDGRLKIKKFTGGDSKKKNGQSASLPGAKTGESTPAKKVRRISEDLGRLQSYDTVRSKLPKNPINLSDEKERDDVATEPRTDTEMAHAIRRTPKKLQSNLNRSKSPKKAAGILVRRGHEIDRKLAIPSYIPKNVNKRRLGNGESILHEACKKGREKYAKILLEAGADPNTKDNANWTPLQEAVAFGHTNICKMLLEFGALPNTPGSDKKTALHEAVINNKLDEAALLLKFKAKTNVYDKADKRPLDYAVTDEMRALLTNINDAGESAEDGIEEKGVHHALDQSIITPNAKVVVFSSNLSDKNKKLLNQIAPKLKLSVATVFRSDVTHIVVESNERNIIKLSYNVMLAILEGKWILNSQWIAIAADADDVTEIDFRLFEVYGAPYPGTPERSRINKEKGNPRLFDNCFFYFTIGIGSSWKSGELELEKQHLTSLVHAGGGTVRKREPNPETIEDIPELAFHLAHQPNHSLHKCLHYIIYMPGNDEPRVKYNMPHIKTLPLAWFLESIEKFELVDPILMGIY